MVGSSLYVRPLMVLTRVASVSTQFCCCGGVGRQDVAQAGAEGVGGGGVARRARRDADRTHAGSSRERRFIQPSATHPPTHLEHVFDLGLGIKVDLRREGGGGSDAEFRPGSDAQARERTAGTPHGGRGSGAARSGLLGRQPSAPAPAPAPAPATGPRTCSVEPAHFRYSGMPPVGVQLEVKASTSCGWGMGEREGEGAVCGEARAGGRSPGRQRPPTPHGLLRAASPQARTRMPALRLSSSSCSRWAGGGQCSGGRGWSAQAGEQAWRLPGGRPAAHRPSLSHSPARAAPPR